MGAKVLSGHRVRNRFFSVGGVGLASAAALMAGPRSASANLVITPTFDSSITGDANAAAIESTINNAIATYEADFADPINVNITFAEMSSGLGQSNFVLYNVPYSTGHAALVADSKTADDAVAVSHLPSGANNPVTGTTNMFMKPANIKALNISFAAPSSDGTIGLNTHITDVGSPGTSGQYSLRAVAQHEIDEILGLGSTLGLGAPYTDPATEDLYRYDGSGNRSYTNSTAATAYFSIDGTTKLDQFNQSGSGDYGDWASSGTPQVQDAFATPNSSPTLNVELRALDVIGYDRVNIPEPTTGLLVTGGLLVAGAFRPRRRAN